MALDPLAAVPVDEGPAAGALSPIDAERWAPLEEYRREGDQLLILRARAAEAAEHLAARREAVKAQEAVVAELARTMGADPARLLVGVPWTGRRRTARAGRKQP